MSAIENTKARRNAQKSKGDLVSRPVSTLPTWAICVGTFLIMENGGKVCVSALPPYFHFTILSNSYKIGKFTYKLIAAIRHNILVLLPRAGVEREGCVEQLINLVESFLCVEFFNLLSRAVDYRLRNVAAGVVQW